ncbi:MAG: hypothetical protein ACEQSB_01180 [Undibacterium sp.]
MSHYVIVREDVVQNGPNRILLHWNAPGKVDEPWVVGQLGHVVARQEYRIKIFPYPKRARDFIAKFSDICRGCTVGRLIYSNDGLSVSVELLPDKK